jgi:ribosomal protein L11 methyltransferase
MAEETGDAGARFSGEAVLGDAQTEAQGRERPAEFARVRIESADAELLERAAAEAYEAGAAGALEETGALVLFAPASALTAIAAALAPLGVAGLRIHGAAPEARVEWSEAWKAGLGPVVISPRLLVRPPFAAAPEGFSGRKIVIEPGQAFGTGGHATTRLALAGIDALPQDALRGARILDVGCGSGVLALAALALGAAHATGCDLDPLATQAAERAAAQNDLADRASWFTGSTAALAGPYDGIVANLLRSEMEPLLGDFARLARPGAWLVLAGLLAAERGTIADALARVGFRCVGERVETDATGDVWLGLVAERK